ncbi:MAG TPA: indolepyruvate oxidoreductase subunit beta [Spirochaetota bacterium]|nr:indolepyruvate oxidoreductase subunit beta [Spirochaetota bacterium]HNT09349.1 indolepyruvate oxidoreductase subunit beta [Spirochaetota bacterium]
MTNVIFAGVGGQGVILASKILMQVAMNAGYDVKESEVHGMAQRGGSVDCNVRYGEKVYSPLIEKGTCDYLVVFEPLEATRKLEYLKPDGTLIVHTERVNPAPVQAGLAKYPDDIETWIVANITNRMVADFGPVLKAVGSQRALNIVMLGVLSNHLEFTPDQWIEAVKGTVKQNFVEMNVKAFTMGREFTIS